ncbi:hypothetical protein ABK040_008886 [Willaertia magna]
MKLVVLEEPTKFDETIAQIVQENPKSAILVYITGKVDESTGKSWCPDCVKSEPIVFEELIPEIENQCKSKDESSVVVLKCIVERSQYKGNSSYPYRTHTDLRVKGIPTMILWNLKDDDKARIDDFNDFDTLNGIRVKAVKLLKQ